MSKIEELIEKLCPNGVEYKKLDEVCNFNRGTSMTSKNAIEGDVPVISGGQKPAFYHNASNRPAGTITIAGSGAYAGYVAFWDKPIFCADSFSVDVKDDKILDKKFLCYYLLNKQQDIYNKKTGAGIAHVHGKDIAKFKIPVPPFEVQCEIVHIFDDFTLLSAELSAELKARQKQFAYFEEKLLFNNNFEKVKLADLCIVNQGLQIPINQRKKKPAENRYFYITVQFLKGGDEKYYIESPQQNVICKKEDILVTRTGSTGKIITGVEGCFHNNFFKVEPNERILKRYLYFVLNSKRMYNKMIRTSSGGTVPDLPHRKFYNLEIFLPSIDEQKKIINVLERFEKLCNDISEGLPAEIEARQKQYEYYRDKLLTFKELKVNE